MTVMSFRATFIDVPAHKTVTFEALSTFATEIYAVCSANSVSVTVVTTVVTLVYCTAFCTVATDIEIVILARANVTLAVFRSCDIDTVGVFVTFCVTIFTFIDIIAIFAITNVSSGTCAFI